MKPTSFVAVLVFLVACFLGSVRAQTHDKQDEIPIERCDRLPIVTMKVAGENRRFLLDTAATTILNLKSFTSGESRQVPLQNKTRTSQTRAGRHDPARSAPQPNCIDLQGLFCRAPCRYQRFGCRGITGVMSSCPDALTFVRLTKGFLLVHY